MGEFISKSFDNKPGSTILNCLKFLNLVTSYSFEEWIAVIYM